MARTDEENGALYREAALEMGLIYVFRKNWMKPTDVAFNFYINSNGDVKSVSDPFKLAELILLGEKFTDNWDHGDHYIMLGSYASVTELHSPYRYDDESYGQVFWDYEWEVQSPSITLEAWLVDELYRKANTHSQRVIRHKFMMLLAKKNKQPLSWYERNLWWLPL